MRGLYGNLCTDVDREDLPKHNYTCITMRQGVQPSDWTSVMLQVDQDPVKTTAVIADLAALRRQVGILAWIRSWINT